MSVAPSSPRTIGHRRVVTSFLEVVATSQPRCEVEVPRAKAWARTRSTLRGCLRRDLRLGPGCLDHYRGQGPVRRRPRRADIGGECLAESLLQGPQERLADGRVVSLANAVSGVPPAQRLDGGHDQVQL